MSESDCKLALPNVYLRHNCHTFGTASLGAILAFIRSFLPLTFSLILFRLLLSWSLKTILFGPIPCACIIVGIVPAMLGRRFRCWRCRPRCGTLALDAGLVPASIISNMSKKRTSSVSLFTFTPTTLCSASPRFGILWCYFPARLDRPKKLLIIVCRVATIHRRTSLRSLKSLFGTRRFTGELGRLCTIFEHRSCARGRL